MKIRRIVAPLVAVAAVLALSVSPASAHLNDAAGKGVGTPVQEHVQERGGLGHIGMECGAGERTPLSPLGLPCPAQR